MAEKIYMLGHGDQERGFNKDSEGNAPLPTFYAWEDGAWAEMPIDVEHLNGLTGMMTNNDPCYAVLFVPYTAITFDSDNKVTNVQFPE